MTETISQSQSGRLVHQLLAHSYLIYLAAIVVGFGADLIYPVSFSFPLLEPLGALLIIFGTVVAFWAQRSARRGSHLRNTETEKICRDHFCVGPYVFTRSPTQYGLSFMLLGLAFLYGSFFLVITTLAAFLIGRFIYVPKQEYHLEAKYGAPYLEYKKHVKF